MTFPDTDGFQLLIFDWDGTLVDSLSNIVACMQAALIEVDLPLADDEVIRRGVGLGLREMVETICPGCEEERFQGILDAYRRLWFEKFSRHPKLIPGARTTLEELFRRGYLLAVATAKGRRGLEIELEATGLKPVFVATRTADEAQAKPHPQMLFDLQDELGARTDETVMIGDTPHDLQMAKNADTPRIGVSTGTYGVPELEELQPLTVLKSVAGLIPWLDSAMNQDL